MRNDLDTVELVVGGGSIWTWDDTPPPQGNAALAPAACARVTFGAPLPTRTMASATTARTSFDLKKPFMNVSPNYLKYTTTKSPEKEVP